ncbi:GGDEF domain-containing protein [Stomatohabitans albus]|uniref:GGDEF domain-containing protein n=1 Tax=Stomatohabitans albus TaxID=3110766 RepID=UPI00300CED62
MATTPSTLRIPVTLGAVLVVLAASSVLPWVSSTAIQYSLLTIMFLSLAYRVIVGPARLVYGAAFIALSIFFFWQIFAYTLFPQYKFIISSISPILAYGFTIFCVEIVQHFRWRTTLFNTTSTAILLAALLFVQLWEGESFRATFMFAAMNYLLVIWLFGKALEIRPWSKKTPPGIRMLDTGFIFLTASTGIYILAHVAPNHPIYIWSTTYGIADVLVNIALVCIALTAISGCSLTLPRDTVVRYGFGQDITLAFVPLLLGISGTSSISVVSQVILGTAALISTVMLLVEIDNLQHRLHVTNKRVKSIAITDRVTGLPNRYALPTFADNTIVNATIIDVIGLRLVNTTYGYEVGDNVLKEFAQRLIARVEDRGIVLRSSGNEFIVLWTRKVLDIESRLRSTIAIPYEIEDERIYLSLECGFSDAANQPLSVLVNEAYRAKERERQAL